MLLGIYFYHVRPPVCRAFVLDCHRTEQLLLPQSAEYFEEGGVEKGWSGKASRKHTYIILTPLNLGFTGVYIIFLISA